MADVRRGARPDRTDVPIGAVYAPQHHKPGKVQQTKAIADSDADDAPADWSVQPDPVADQHA